MFISIEAVDGAGKSTQAKLLRERLTDLGYDVVLTREPGGSPGATDIRALLLSGEPDKWSAMTEVLLFTAARRDHVEKTIRPALDAGKIVICDRYLDSTRVYQSARGDDMRGKIDLLHEECVGLMPDMTILIDVDPEFALKRADARNASSSVDEARFEKLGLEFQKKLRSGFLEIADSETAKSKEAAIPPRFEVLDGHGSIGEVARQIEERVMARISLSMENSQTPSLA